MLHPTKPGSEEYQDNVRHYKKLERLVPKCNGKQVARVSRTDLLVSSNCHKSGFKITLVNMNKFKPPSSARGSRDEQDSSLSGSDPNQSLRNLDESHEEMQEQQPAGSPRNHRK